MPSFLKHRFSIQIGTVILLWFLCIIISGFLLLIPQFGGLELLENPQKHDLRSIKSTKLYLVLSHTIGFILPAFFFGLIFYKDRVRSFFKMTKIPIAIIAALSVIFLFASYPIIAFSNEINGYFPIGPDLLSLESKSMNMLQRVLNMDHIGDLMINLFIIAIIPAVGEELIFRGVIQQLIHKRFNKPVLAIWLTTILFSALHLQAGSFIPKMALGICFGYLFYLTGNLWISILAHFANNALQVISLYLAPKDMIASLMENNGNGSMQLIPWWVIIISIILLYFLSEMIKKLVKEEHV